MIQTITQLLFYANLILVAIFLMNGFRKRGGYLEVPFLTALISTIWYIPQAYVLLDDRSLPAESMARVLFMSFICLAATWAGWQIGGGARSYRLAKIQIPFERIFWPTVFITLFAAIMRVLIFMQPPEVRAAAQWTGIITIYAFFAQVGLVSFLFSIALLINRRSPESIGLACANIALYIAPLLFYFRRAETFEFIFGILLCGYFFKGYRIPRAIVAFGLIAGFMFVNSVGELRALGGGYTLDASGNISAKIPTMAELTNIDWFGVDKFEKNKHISEVRNAAIYMSVTFDTASFDLGGQLWNKLVLAYIPGQIVGYELKRSLLIGENISYLAVVYASYETYIGTTLTGFTEPYLDFWYFGAIVFYLTAKFLARQFRNAHRGSLMGFMLYAALLPMAVQTITHSGYYLIVHAPLTVAAIWLSLRTYRSTSINRKLLQDGRLEARRALPSEKFR